MIKPAGAQSTPTPSIPEVTVTFVNSSYNVTTSNAYTGVNETEQISNNSIEVKIKNQPFDCSNNQIYYNVRAKPHFADNWTEVYPLENLTSSYNNGDGTFSYAEYISADSASQSSSSQTIITFPVVPTEFYGETGYDIQRYYLGGEDRESGYSAFLSGIPYRAQIDFEVEALVGHSSQMWVIQHPLAPQYGGYFEPAIAFDAASGWSNTQTVTIGENSPTSTPTASASPTENPATPTPSGANSAASQFGLNWTEITIIAVLCIVVVLVVVIAFMRRRIRVLEHKAGNSEAK